MKNPQRSYQHRLQNDKPLLSFEILADLHLALPRRNAHLDTALDDIWQRDEKKVVILGDFANNGYSFQWKQCLSQLREFPFQYAIALGNHDLYNVFHRNQMHIHPLYKSMILKDHKQLYYDLWWNGFHIYVLNSQHPDKSCAIFYADQLQWLEDGLKKDDPDKPVLVLCHHPLAHTHRYTNTLKQTIGFQSDDLKRILHTHKKVIYISAHLHNDVSECTICGDSHGFLIDVPSFHQVVNGDRHKCCGYRLELYHEFAYLRTRDYLQPCWLRSHAYILSFNDNRVYVLDEDDLKMPKSQ